jgi:hypothetical protein
MPAVLPSLFNFRPGRERVVYRATAQAVGGGATYDTPLAASFPAITVAAGDILSRGGEKEVVIDALSTAAGTVHVRRHAANGTAIVGTVASLALGAGTAGGTVVPLSASGTVPTNRYSVAYINGAGAATLDLEVRAR